MMFDRKDYTVRRGWIRDEVEAIYEALLRDNPEEATARCEQMLFNHVGNNEIKNRVALDLRRRAPGARGAMLADRDQTSVAQVGQKPSGCEAHAKEKAA